jgi:hypothetical protein
MLAMIHLSVKTGIAGGYGGIDKFNYLNQGVSNNNRHSTPGEMGSESSFSTNHRIQ